MMEKWMSVSKARCATGICVRRVARRGARRLAPDRVAVVDVDVDAPRNAMRAQPVSSSERTTAWAALDTPRGLAGPSAGADSRDRG
jgi:hypothetical protein